MRQEVLALLHTHQSYLGLRQCLRREWAPYACDSVLRRTFAQMCDALPSVAQVPSAAANFVELEALRWENRKLTDAKLVAETQVKSLVLYIPTCSNNAVFDFACTPQY